VSPPDAGTQRSTPQAASGSTAQPVDTGSVSKSDAAKDDAASSGGCPASDPKPGSPCSGDLRCRLARHGDCQSPSCPAHCTYLGIAPGAMVTSGVVYFAMCQDGQWTQTTEGNCSGNRDAAVCDCPDADAGM